MRLEMNQEIARFNIFPEGSVVVREYAGRFAVESSDRDGFVAVSDTLPPAMAAALDFAGYPLDALRDAEPASEPDPGTSLVDQAIDRSRRERGLPVERSRR